MSSVELECALAKHPLVTEAAVVGCPHEIKGQRICCFVTLVKSDQHKRLENEVKKELIQSMRTTIGPIATPDYIAIVESKSIMVK